MESLCSVTCKRYNSRSEESTLLEVKKVQCNKTEKNDTELNKKEEGEAAPRSWKTMVRKHWNNVKISISLRDSVNDSANCNGYGR